MPPFPRLFKPNQPDGTALTEQRGRPLPGLEAGGGFFEAGVKGGGREEISHEGLVSLRSAHRGRNVRRHPDLTASNAKWSRAECRSRPGDHLWTLPSSSPTGVQTCLPPGLLWGFVLGLVRLLLTSVLGVNRTANRQS